MKIKHIRSKIKDLELIKPYTVAYQTYTSAVNAFIEIELDNGMIGLGAAAEGEYVIGETMDETKANLQSDTMNFLIDRDIRHINPLIRTSNALFADFPATRAAIDIALHDVFCKYLEVPVVDFYGRKHDKMPTSVTIGISSVEETLQEANEYKMRGFRILKVKMGHNVDLDIERCKKLKEQFGNYFTIRVDANQGYDQAKTERFYHATRNLGLELIEQPMPVGSEEDMLYLPEDIRKMIACDESLKNAGSAFKLASPPQNCGIFNIKLMKCGGIKGALDIATIAQSAGIDLFWGCFDESIISISAALHAAFACPNTRYLDLDGSLDLAEDVVKGGFIIHDGVMSIAGGPGLGCTPL